jgi:hypothetical protein
MCGAQGSDARRRKPCKELRGCRIRFALKQEAYMAEMYSGKPSRRQLLRGFAVAVGAAGLGLTASPAMAKHQLSQQQVHYQDQPKGDHQCSGCKHYQPDKQACDIVAGKIAPNGWCSMWTPRPK